MGFHGELASVIGWAALLRDVYLEGALPFVHEGGKLPDGADASVGLDLGVFLDAVRRRDQHRSHADLLRPGYVDGEPVSDEDGLGRRYIQRIQRLAVDGRDGVSPRRPRRSTPGRGRTPAAQSGRGRRRALSGVHQVFDTRPSSSTLIDQVAKHAGCIRVGQPDCLVRWCGSTRPARRPMPALTT